jgi:hypothetical protein
MSPERRDKNGIVLLGDQLWTFGGTTDCGPIDDVWTADVRTPVWTATYSAQVGETCYRLAKPGQTCPTDCGKPL